MTSHKYSKGDVNKSSEHSLGNSWHNLQHSRKETFVMAVKEKIGVKQFEKAKEVSGKGNMIKGTEITILVAVY